MAIVLYCMHMFWTFLIIKIGLKSIGKKGWDNVHDKKIKHWYISYLLFYVYYNVELSQL